MEKGHLHAVDYTSVAVYFALMVMMGIYFSRYMKSDRDYFSGGHRLPWWLAGVSFFMSGFSAMGIVMYARIAYQYGLVAASLCWTVVPGVFLGARVLSHKWRRAGILTPVEFLERRYHIAIRQVFAWAGIPVKVIDDGMKIFALGTFVSAGLGMNLRFSIIASGLVMLFYTVLGGLWAVTVTDTIQFVVLTAAMLVVLPLSIHHIGGIGAFVGGSPEGFFGFLNGPYSLFYYISFLILIGMSYNTTWALVQRYYSVPDERDARRVGYLAAGLNIFGPLLWILPGMAARQILPELAESGQLEYVYALLTFKLLPVGMIGIVISAMFAATMSSLDSDYNILSAVITRDFYHRILRPNATSKQLLTFGRVMSTCIGVAATTAALVMLETGNKDLFKNMVILFGLALPPTVVPMLSGLLWKRVYWRAAFAGFSAGLACGIALLIAKGPLAAALDVSSNTMQGLSFLVSTGATLLAMYVTSRFERPSSEEQERVQGFFAQLERPVERPPADEKGVPSPFFIVGIMTGAIGLMLILIGIWTLKSGMGPGINLGMGLVLAGIGYALVRRARTRISNTDGTDL